MSKHHCPLGAYMSLSAVPPSVSMCRLHRQHHMAPDSFHTFSLYSTKLLNPCQKGRERETALHPALPSVYGDAVFSSQGLCQVFMSDLISVHVHLSFGSGVRSFSHVSLSALKLTGRTNPGVIKSKEKCNDLQANLCPCTNTPYSAACSAKMPPSYPPWSDLLLPMTFTLWNVSKPLTSHKSRHLTT